jgi:hypothetical protein
MKKWATISFEEILPMLSGLFSLNNVFTHLRVVEKITPQVEHFFT